MKPIKITRTLREKIASALHESHLGQELIPEATHMTRKEIYNELSTCDNMDKLYAYVEDLLLDDANIINDAVIIYDTVAEMPGDMQITWEG